MKIIWATAIALAALLASALAADVLSPGQMPATQKQEKADRPSEPYVEGGKRMAPEGFQPDPRYVAFVNDRYTAVYMRVSRADGTSNILLWRGQFTTQYIDGARAACMCWSSEAPVRRCSGSHAIWVPAGYEFHFGQTGNLAKCGFDF